MSPRSNENRCNDAVCYMYLAEILSCVGRTGEALGMVEQALRCKPDTADVHLNTAGTAYYLAGRPEGFCQV